MASTTSGMPANANRQRIERLQNRLHSLQNNMEATQTNKSAHATSLISNLKDRFNTQQSQTKSKFDAISNLLEQVSKQIES